jgi:NAD(P)-dependent dehydrogenase (short-subunit alcohol dehydrogenase family)
MSNESTAKIALVTGGSRGIGKATALTLAARGIDVVVTYVSAESEANEVVETIRTSGRRAVAMRLDLAKTDTFDGFVVDLKKRLAQVWQRERIDFLVNNGGAGTGSTVAETTEAAFDAVVGVHFRGPFFLTQKLLPVLADGGRIVNVSSGLSRYALPGVGVYAAAKSALEAVARSLAIELGPRRIAVNTVAPGGIVTDYGGGFMRTNEPLRKAVAAETPLGRLGEPEDVADLIAALLSPDTRWLTGQRIEATGGYRL